MPLVIRCRLMQKLFSRSLIYLCSNRTHRKHGGIKLALRNLNMSKLLMLQLYHGLFGCLFLILIIFALDVALFLKIKNYYYKLLIGTRNQFNFMFFNPSQRGSVSSGVSSTT
jgi:hypothetical protein